MVKGKLLSLELWTKLFSIFALIGIVLFLAGRVAKVKAMVLAGAYLGLPLLALGVLVLVLVIPYVLLAGRSRRRNK